MDEFYCQRKTCSSKKWLYCGIQCVVVQCIVLLRCSLRTGRQARKTAASPELAEKTKQSFLDTFLNEYGYLYDYVDGNMIDWSVRPNMIFPVAFDYSPLSQDRKKKVLDICTRELLTPKGLRSLSPKSGGYNPVYVGPQSQRDYAYHQGTAWPWLGGFYMEASLKLYRRTRLSFIERRWWDMKMKCLIIVSEPSANSLMATHHSPDVVPLPLP